MADEPAGPGPLEDLFFIVGALIVLVTIWYATGGPSRATLGGIFLAPPPPLSTGGGYGPQIGKPASSTQIEVNQ